MTTRTRTPAEVEAGAIGIVAAIYRLTHDAGQPAEGGVTG